MDWNPLNWAGDVSKWFGSNVGDFFKGLAGQLAGAFEVGALAIFKDVWYVISGPIEILAGALLALIALGIAFRNDIAGVAMAAMR